MSLLVSGIGMISAVGHDVATSCASIRAGIVRPSELVHFSVIEEDTHRSESLTGYPISNYTDGFGSVGRWITMATHAVKDLINYSGLSENIDQLLWERTALVFVTPSLDAAKFEFEGVINSENAVDMLIQPVISQLDVSVQLESCFVVSEDNTGLMKSFPIVSQLLARDVIDKVIVICIDSNIDAYSLTWLNGMQQLKTVSRPVGLIPGECGVALLIESQSSMIQRNARPLLVVKSVNTRFEENNYFSEIPNTGNALGQSICELLNSQENKKRFNGYFFTDLNGEEWRAREYSGARVNTLNEYLASDMIEIIPALSLGDTGVVHSAISICLLIESKRRGYAFCDNGLIVASSPTGSVASIFVTVL